jgi:hypothetical protein
MQVEAPAVRSATVPLALGRPDIAQSVLRQSLQSIVQALVTKG